MSSRPNLVLRRRLPLRGADRESFWLYAALMAFGAGIATRR